MKKLILIIISVFCCQLLFAQDDTLAKKPDTIVMAAANIVPLHINCYVVNGFGSGDQELLVLNSPTDVQYAFGYNCTFPDVDFLTKTVLYFSIKSCGDVTYKIKSVGNRMIYSVFINTDCFQLQRQIISVVIPKMGVDNSVSLDVTDLGKH